MISFRFSSHTSEGVKRDIKKSTIVFCHIILDIWIIIILFKIILCFWMAHVARLILHKHLLSLTKWQDVCDINTNDVNCKEYWQKKKTSTCEKPWGSWFSSAVFLELEKMAETNPPNRWQLLFKNYLLDLTPFISWIYRGTSK